MFAVRAAVAVALSGAAIVPSAVAFASSGGDDHVADLARRAIEAVQTERQLLDELRLSDNPTLAETGPDQQRLIDADERGNRLLIEMIMAGVDLTDAATTALERLPKPAVPGGAPVLPPPRVVYDAAIDDLTRIAEAPGTATAADHDNRGSLGLLAVAAAALLALGLAALSNALRNKGDGSLEAMAWTDGLTGVGNRRKLDRDLAAQQRLEHGQTAVIMVDIDHFKSINDQYGHQVGDDVLRRFSAALADEVREGDIVYRYGGEEFCVLLPGASREDAGSVADRIVAAARAVVLPDDKHITVSVGVADGEPSDVVDTLESADRALYAAKAAGRDQLQHI